MSRTTIPGFTAEASLFTSSKNYRPAAARYTYPTNAQMVVPQRKDLITHMVALCIVLCIQKTRAIVRGFAFTMGPADLDLLPNVSYPE
jgi:hypothetical protein